LLSIWWIKEDKPLHEQFVSNSSSEIDPQKDGGRNKAPKPNLIIRAWCQSFSRGDSVDLGLMAGGVLSLLPLSCGHSLAQNSTDGEQPS